ncbi:uncharacterized protein LOC124494879 isoform X2 [Dermatophagoides farinae]|uniref:Nuclear transcription factor Y subunit gamma n=1 Tax=Dermatophagoides farinae TaxID=6954 RepID=A0A922KZ72_DERFA|nr:nuclear transcription factor Y subunit gamma-like [Dermatophagoides farinae]KAH7645278.1 histone-like protein transcription factor -like protein [Dermatophagoides farinae]KAH9497923.1 hypothetical protein DERF_013861 [Dermatophagoides farinae]
MESISKNVSAEAIQMLETFWKREMVSVQNTTCNDFRNQELPLARIKKIMKLDEDVQMISAEAPVLFAKAVEMFIAELSLRAWINTEENKRRTLQRNDISTAISKYDQFDFLIDIVPRETKPVNRKSDTRGSNTITNQDQYNYLVQIPQTPSTIHHHTGTGQPIQILQTTPNQSNQFSLSPQIIQVPIQSSSSSSTNHDATTHIINQNSQVQQLPITLSSQQYQTLIQNQNSNQQQILLPTQYLATNTHGQMVQTLISTSSSQALNNSTNINNNNNKIITQQTNRSHSTIAQSRPS